MSRAMNNPAARAKRNKVMKQASGNVAGRGNQFFARGLTLARGASVGVMVINRTTQARYGTTFTIR